MTTTTRQVISPTSIDIMMQELRKANALAECEQRYIKLNHKNL